MERSCEFQWFGQKWKCVRGTVDDDDGGQCDIMAKVVTINSEVDDEEFLSILHHELFEGGTYLVGCTYTREYPDKQDLLIMTHSQMDLISGSVRGAYEEIKKLMMLPSRKRKTRKS